MMELLSRLLEILAFIWLVRFLLSNVFGGGNRSAAFRPANPPQSTSQSSQGPTVITGEMKKDPQCGTYVSTEVSLKTRHAGEVLHFCSRECQEAYFQAQSSKPA